MTHGATGAQIMAGPLCNTAKILCRSHAERRGQKNMKIGARHVALELAGPDGTQNRYNA